MNPTVLFRSHPIRIAALFLALALPAFASVAGTFDRNLQVNGAVDLEVLTKSGDITIHNGSARNGFDPRQDSRR